MKYQIRTNRGAFGWEEITEGYFNQLNASHCCLINSYQFEQKFDLVIGNFLELESDVFKAVMDHMVGRYPGWINHFEVQLTINRRLSNLLSACRTYFDQIYRHMILCFGGDKAKARLLKNYASSMYDGHREYRLMEALRNHVQHHSLAVHGCTVGGKSVGEGEESQIQYGVGFSVNKEEVAHNRRFKAEVLKEMDDQVDIVSAVRVYIDCINRIQQRGRLLLDPKIAESFAVLVDVSVPAAELNKTPQRCAMRTDDNGKMDKLIPLNLILHEEIGKLREKNKGELKFDTGFFTSDSIN